MAPFRAALLAQCTKDLLHFNTLATVHLVSLNSSFKANQRSGQRIQKWIKVRDATVNCCYLFFSVKISDKVEELQQSAEIKLCTHKKNLQVLALQHLGEVFLFTARLEWEECTKSSHWQPKKFLLKPMCAYVFPWVLLQSLVPNPSVQSVDDLWLPGLSGHLGATLSNDRRSGGGLAVQTQAADRVLQSHSFGSPLLQETRTARRVFQCCRHSVPRCSTHTGAPPVSRPRCSWIDGAAELTA